MGTNSQIIIAIMVLWAAAYVANMLEEYMKDLKKRKQHQHYKETRTHQP